MAAHNKKPVIVINHKAEVLSYYESLQECITINGFPPTSVYHAYQKKRPYRCMMFIPEPEYREHWECGTIHLLRFKTQKQRNKEAGARLVALRIANGSEENRRKKISEAMKKRHAGGKPYPFEKAMDKMKKSVKCLDTGATYSSMSEAARNFGVRLSYMSRAVHKGWKVHGYKLCFTEDSIIETEITAPA